MLALIEVVLPVFLVLAGGYAAVWRGVMSSQAVDELMRFATGIAIPILLFRAMASLDIGNDFSPAVLFSFYSGAATCFTVGILGARYLFGRPWEDSVVIGFAGLYSNTLLLGLPITERAYGDEALRFMYPIIALHPLFCYILGTCTMELVRNRGAGGLGRVVLNILRSLARNPLIIGITLGLAVNVTGLPMPKVLDDALALIARAGLPAALFGLGGVLYTYRPDGDLRVIGYVVAMSLGVQPVVTWLMGAQLGLTIDQFRAAVMAAAMPSGINAYLFAHMYGKAKRVSASAMLVATTLSVLTSWFWLLVLP